MEKQKQESQRNRLDQANREFLLTKFPGLREVRLLKEEPEDLGFSRFVDFFGQYRLKVGRDVRPALELCGILEWIYNNGLGDKFLAHVETSVRNAAPPEVVKNGRF
jgi:hypothetical protein